MTSDIKIAHAQQIPAITPRTVLYPNTAIKLFAVINNSELIIEK